MTASFTPKRGTSERRKAVGAKLFRLRDDAANMQLRVRLMMSPTKLLPEPSWRGLRTRIMRMAGWRIGYGTAFFGVPTMYGRGPIRERFRIGEWCIINLGSTFELNDCITIGNSVSIGHQVLLLTTTHDVEGPERRAGTLRSAPISIGDGVWLGARSVVLPGVSIGDGAVVAAGSIVTRDVRRNTLVGGTPAQELKQLD